MVMRVLQSMETRESSEHPAGQEVWRHLAHVSDLFRSVAAQKEPRTDLNRITVNQARIFGYLFRQRSGGEPVRIKTLAHDLDVSSAAASQAVDRLVAWGMVERTVDPDDRRAVRLSFTPKGDALLRRHEQRAEELLDSVRGTCTPEDFEVFGRVLAALVAELERRWEALLDQKAAARAKGPGEPHDTI